MQQAVHVFAPATIANLNCGFDVLGLAISTPGDIVTARFGGKGLSIASITGDRGQLPTDILSNTAGMAVKCLLEHLEVKKDIELIIEKQMPIGCGLGSSAASAVGAVIAVNELLRAHLTPTELLPFAMEGENVASGSYHADSVAPCMMGGIVLISSYDPLTVIQLPVPPGLWTAVVNPTVTINTMEARAILPDSVCLKDAIRQSGNIAGFISGLYSEDYEIISRSMRDHLIEKHRSDLIPGFSEVKNAAMSHGALGFGISGSGPSVFALCKGEIMAKAVSLKMREAFTSMNISSKAYVSAVNTHGPIILDP